MPLESGTTIEQLDQNWPLGTDTVTNGDDHLRLIKEVLKKQFPGSGGNGFSKPITITEDELNGIVGAVAKAVKDSAPLHHKHEAADVDDGVLDANRIPHAVKSGTSGVGFGGFRYTISGTTLNLFTS